MPRSSMATRCRYCCCCTSRTPPGPGGTGECMWAVHVCAQGAVQTDVQVLPVPDCHAPLPFRYREHKDTCAVIALSLGMQQRKQQVWNWPGCGIRVGPVLLMPSCSACRRCGIHLGVEPG